MAQVYGDFRENLPDNHEFLSIGFSPGSIPIQQRWRNNGISADFIADYLATFVPINEDSSEMQQKRSEVRGAVSYIANELLENAMKFSDESSRHPIRFGLHLVEGSARTIVLLASNSVSLTVLNTFKAFIEEFLNANVDELYLRQLEKNAEDDEGYASGLGLLTMKNDYHAKLGWKVETLEHIPAGAIVTTMVQIEI
ncbi:MAG: DUF6272 family protein [Cyanobacteria bacterium J06641_5]